MNTLTGKNVMVTGGAGFIGSHLCERIAKDNPTSIVAVDNLFLGREANLADARAAYPDLIFVNQDVADFDGMHALLKQHPVDVMFMLATIPLPTSLEKPRWTCDINCGIATVAAELQRLGLFETLIAYSTSETYGSAVLDVMDETHPYNPETPYAASKLAGDLIIDSYRRTFGADVSVVRPFNNFGPRQNDKAYAGVIPVFINRIRAGLPLQITGDGTQTRDFVFVRDVADATVKTYEKPGARGEFINLASGRETSVNELAQVIIEVMGRNPGIEHVAPRAGDVMRHCGGIEKARSLLDFNPCVSLADGMAETVAWYLQGDGASASETGVS